MSLKSFFRSFSVVGKLSALCVICLCALSLFGGKPFQTFIQYSLNHVIQYFSWLFLSTMSFSVLFMLVLALSPAGRLKLGTGAKEFSYGSWFAMMFSAGMGIGLLFYGVAEPVFHYLTPAPGLSPDSVLRKQEAVSLAIFHWGVHPWACYAAVGLFIGYFSHNQEHSYSLRHCLAPAIKGPWQNILGNMVDILTIVCTISGVATSLGLGVMQISAGLNHYVSMDQSITFQTVLIAAITAAATLSVLSGLKKGIKILSLVNVAIVSFLVLFVILEINTASILPAFIDNLIGYGKIILPRSFSLGIHDSKWLQSWTLFYWAWWLSWSPFVGIFIAKISKGRSIREYIFCVIAIPTLVAILWFSIFGTSGVHEAAINPLLAEKIKLDVAKGFFYYIDQISGNSLATILGSFTMFSSILFFVTSSDSASMVVHSVAAGSQKTSNQHKVFWALLEGLVAAVLLQFGGLTGLQSVAILCALPLCFILIIAGGVFVRQVISDYQCRDHLS